MVAWFSAERMGWRREGFWLPRCSLCIHSFQCQPMWMRGIKFWGSTDPPALLRRSSQWPGGHGCQALVLPGLEGRGRFLHTEVPGTCSGLAFPVTAFLPALCLSHVTQVRLMAGFLWLVGHEPNIVITLKLQCLLCKRVVTFRSDWKVNFSSLLRSFCFFSQLYSVQFSETYFLLYSKPK